jgi:hypothetical protein
MAEVSDDSLAHAVERLRHIIDKGKCRGADIIYSRPYWRFGFVDYLHLPIGQKIYADLKAAKEWLEIVSNYGGGIEPQRHSIKDCIAHVEALIAVIEVGKATPGFKLEICGDDFPVFVSAERYLDRALMLREADSAERRNKARPKGGWKRNK